MVYAEGVNRPVRDLKVATAFSVTTETLLLVRSYLVTSDLHAPAHPWLEMSQMPGAQIVETMFRQIRPSLNSAAAFVLAYAILFVIQAGLYSLVVWGAIYVYRTYTTRTRKPLWPNRTN